jgi:hypothetical protein
MFFVTKAMVVTPSKSSKPVEIPMVACNSPAKDASEFYNSLVDSALCVGRKEVNLYGDPELFAGSKFLLTVEKNECLINI